MKKEITHINVSIEERTPVWTDRQLKAMVGLLEVQCNIDPFAKNGCSNQWCQAREAIKQAFGIKLDRNNNGGSSSK